MTCEVMLMNLEGVALAADSAVTIIDGRGGHKISQRGVDKVFTLDESAPVGVMIYGLATFADFPWKTVLGAFRESRSSDGFDNAAACARSLVAFLAGLDAGRDGGMAITEKAEAVAFAEYVEGFVDRYATLLAHQGFDEGAGSPSPDMANAALRRLRDEILLDATYLTEGIIKPVADRRERPRTAEPSQRLASFLAEHLSPRMDRSLSRYFPKGGLEAVKAPLMTLCAQSVLLEWLPPALPATGLVIAGFGRKAHLPSYVNLHVLGAFAGALQYRYDSAGGPSAGKAPVVFESYAQDESIVAFRYGAHNRFMATAYDATTLALARVFEDMIGLIAAKDPSLAREAASIADRALLQTPAIGLTMAMNERESHVARTFGPLLDSASVGVLAAHATKLVELSILEHELTGSGAVGRPISVLKMEKGKCRLEKDGKS